VLAAISSPGNEMATGKADQFYLVAALRIHGDYLHKPMLHDVVLWRMASFTSALIWFAQISSLTCKTSVLLYEALVLSPNS